MSEDTYIKEYDEIINNYFKETKDIVKYLQNNNIKLKDLRKEFKMLKSYLKKFNASKKLIKKGKIKFIHKNKK